MIKTAKTTTDQHGVVNVTFAQSDIPDDGCHGTFNVITAFNVLHYVEDTQKVSRRISDLLSPGGLFISSTACLGERRILFGAVGLIMTKLGNVPEMNFFKKSGLENLISGEGFQIIETAKLSWLPEYFIVAKKIEGHDPAP